MVTLYGGVTSPGASNPGQGPGTYTVQPTPNTGGSVLGNLGNVLLGFVNNGLNGGANTYVMPDGTTRTGPGWGLGGPTASNPGQPAGPGTIGGTYGGTTPGGVLLNGGVNSNNTVPVRNVNEGGGGGNSYESNMVNIPGFGNVSFSAPSTG